MKKNLYFSLTSSAQAVNFESANIKKSEINKEIQSRHANFCADKKATANELKRVYGDWMQVYRRRPAQERMVQQKHIDTLDKMCAYLAPIFACGEYCTITSAESRASEALLSKVSAKTGRTHYLVPVKWTIASLESAVKYCAKYYAGTEVAIDKKLDAIK
jgi:hypothetical protein